MTSERRKEIECRAILTYGAQMQGDMCIEEMSELTKAILKYRRAENKNKNEAAYIAVRLRDLTCARFLWLYSYLLRLTNKKRLKTNFKRFSRIEKMPRREHRAAGV